MSEIKNIIFDLGGVFIKVDYQKTENAFDDLGISITNYNLSKLIEDFETGKINTIGFCNGLRQITQRTSLTNKQIETAWNSMLGGFWKERLIWLESIRKQYNIYSFSNTNEFHYNAFIEIYNQEQINHSFSDYFIKDYYSHIFGMRKPSKESYFKILEEQKLIAEETLFIDDTIKNIDGANQSGLKTLHLLPTMDLEKEVSNYLKK